MSYARASYSTAPTASVHFEEDMDCVDCIDEDEDAEDSYRPPTPYDMSETPADPIDEHGQPCPDSTDALHSIDSSTEMQLEELQQHTEVRQLELLCYESEHIQEHGVQPSYEWFETRFFKIYQYSELNWIDLAHRYHLDNAPLAHQATEIKRALQHLIDEWAVGPVFDLEVYDGVLHAIQALWAYYEAEYVDEAGDDEVSDLISGMTHL